MRINSIVNCSVKSPAFKDGIATFQGKLVSISEKAAFLETSPNHIIGVLLSDCSPIIKFNKIEEFTLIAMN